ncbi:MAG: sterol desaturase family protein [Desulfuromonadia bacterium]
MASEIAIRLVSFAGVFAIVAGLEWLFPRRPRSRSRSERWPVNIGIVILDTLIVRILIPLAPASAALFALSRGWGLLGLLEIPHWLRMFAGVILLDLVVYLQHVLFHALPLFWRLHRMHHTDLDLDVTSGTRFHPLEIAISQVIKIAAVILFGVPPAGVILFEVILNGTALFSHANLKLFPLLDRILRLVMVTPDMHRVHHSVIVRETNSNFGFNLSLWDRLFGTYRPQPEAGHDSMTIGLKEYRDPASLGFLSLLLNPFHR